MVRDYPRRSLLGLSLFVGQAFLYNAVFFTYALVLTKFFKVADARVGLYLIPIGLGNFFGAFILGRLFDTLGRRTMISSSYIVSGLLLVGTAVLFQHGALSAVTLTVCWCVVFFFASAGASSAYLTVSEIFPMETRAMAIAVFYAIGTGLGGVIGPSLFGKLVGTHQLSMVSFGYYLGAGLMIAAGVVELFIGVEAARMPLEKIAAPLSAARQATRTGKGRARQATA
jgi:MFS family permease